MAISQKQLQALQASEQPLSEVEPSFKALIYGQIGAGKTYAAFDIAMKLTPKQIIYVDYAEGWTAVRQHEQFNEIKNRTRRFQYSSMGQLEALAEAIKSGAKGFENIGAIILDEYSSMVDNSLEAVVTKLYKENPSKYDEVLPEWPHFNRNKLICTKIHRLLNHIPGTHVIYLAHAKSRVEQDTGKEFLEPNFNPSYGANFLQDLQLVGMMTAEVRQEKYTRKIQVQPERRVAAKNRLGLSTFTSPIKLADAALEFIGGKETPEDKSNKIQPIVVED